MQALLECGARVVLEPWQNSPLAMAANQVCAPAAILIRGRCCRPRLSASGTPHVNPKLLCALPSHPRFKSTYVLRRVYVSPCGGHNDVS